MKKRYAPQPLRCPDQYLVGYRKDGFSWFLPEHEGDFADDQNLVAAKRFSSLAEALLTSTEHSANVFEVTVDQNDTEKIIEIWIDVKMAESAVFDGGYWLMDNLAVGPTPICLHVPETEQRIERMRRAGVRCVVSLLEESELYWSHEHATQDWFDGFNHHIFPIADQGVPSGKRMALILDVIDGALKRGQTTYVHCHGGRGRAGLVAACFIARHGAAVGQAALNLLTKRRMQHGLFQPSPESEQQRDFAMRWGQGE